MPIRSFVISRAEAGRPLVRFLEEAIRLSRGAALQHLQHRHVRIGGRPCSDPQRRLKAGQRVQVQLPDRPSSAQARSRTEKPTPLPAIANQIRLVYADADILVIDKPAGLTTVRHADETRNLDERARRFLPPTLVDLLPKVLPANFRGGRIRAVHRLDKETSGLVVLARTPAAESALGKLFRKHEVERTYLAIVRGQATTQRIESHLLRDRGDGRRGSSLSGDGQHAVTDVRVLERLGDYTLVECRLETGRTHQVRIHLGERGTPLCGERVYDRPLHGVPLPDESGAKRPMLHAATLGIAHPISGERLEWKSDLPADMARLLRRLRRDRG